MYCDLWWQYIQVRKLFKGGNYLRAETIRGNTVCTKNARNVERCNNRLNTISVFFWYRYINKKLLFFKVCSSIKKYIFLYFPKPSQKWLSELCTEVILLTGSNYIVFVIHIFTNSESTNFFTISFLRFFQNDTEFFYWYKKMYLYLFIFTKEDTLPTLQLLLKRKTRNCMQNKIRRFRIRENMLILQRYRWDFKSGWASSNVVGIICPPGCNRVNWAPKFRVG